MKPAPTSAEATSPVALATMLYSGKGASLYPTVVAVFCSLLLISNIAATKLIAFGPLITDGGALLFPLVYVVGDILSEVFGFKAARRAIFIGFAMSILASITFLLVAMAPPAAGYDNNDAFLSVLGFVPRIVLASLAGYLVGQLLNAYVLVWLKRKTAGKALWLRLLGSTAIGELADTVVFCTIAFFGVITGAEFLIYVVVGYVWKVGVEVVCLPVTYQVIKYVKAREPGYPSTMGQ